MHQALHQADHQEDLQGALREALHLDRRAAHQEDHKVLY
jgi:hypothetical protein